MSWEPLNLEGLYKIIDLISCVVHKLKRELKGLESDNTNCKIIIIIIIKSLTHWYVLDLLVYNMHAWIIRIY